MLYGLDQASAGPLVAEPRFGRLRRVRPWTRCPKTVGRRRVAREDLRGPPAPGSLAGRALQSCRHKALLGPVDCRSADGQGCRDHLVAEAFIRRDLALRAPELAQCAAPPIIAAANCVPTRTCRYLTASAGSQISTYGASANLELTLMAKVLQREPRFT
jgi:hypothetical protein